VRRIDREALDDNPWLAALPVDARAELISAAKIRRFGKNERVHNKGGEADGLYGLLRGEVRVSATTFSGDEIVFTRLSPGEWFGEIAILDGGLRTHDSHTAAASDIAILSRPVLLRVCGRHREVYGALVSLLCEHCRLAFSAIDEFLVYSPEQRMAGRLLERLPLAGNPRVMISQMELGSLVGISRQSTNKILKRWELRAWIKRSYRGIDVCDTTALRGLL
jgi:CRP/FNR family cyclic AMP-dependent transcriptional regulator